jgi:probable phosphoglycerate mutase
MPVTATDAVLVRHGRTAWHAENRYLGRTDLPLDDYGRCQAAALATWAAGQGFTSLVCSSMLRARETADPVAVITGLALRVDDRLRELDFGVAEGMTLPELRAVDAAMVERFVEDPAGGHFPSGEAPADAAERAMAGVAGAVAADPGGRIMLIAHSTIIRLLTCASLGLAASEYRRRLPRLDPLGAVTLRFDESGVAALISFNVPVAADCRDLSG